MTKQACVSSTDQGGVKRRWVIRESNNNDWSFSREFNSVLSRASYCRVAGWNAESAFRTPPKISAAARLPGPPVLLAATACFSIFSASAFVYQRPERSLRQLESRNSRARRVGLIQFLCTGHLFSSCVSGVSWRQNRRFA